MIKVDNKKLAFKATLHCLMGCGLGDIGGATIGVILGLSGLVSEILGIIAAFVLGFYLGTRPLLKSGTKFKDAFKIIFLSELISISVMVGGEVLVESFTGVFFMKNILNIRYWFRLLLSLIAGFAVAYPVNYFMIKSGKGHHHMHMH